MQSNRYNGRRPIIDRIPGLKRDHRTARRHLHVIDRLVRRWLENNALESTHVRELREALVALTTLYNVHLRFEDRALLPLAKRVLTTRQVRQIQNEMIARRTGGAHPQVP
jgi:hemerythrin-like domain-containing protein